MTPRFLKALFGDIQELQVGEVIHEVHVFLEVLQGSFKPGLLLVVVALLGGHVVAEGLEVRDLGGHVVEP